MLKRSPGRLRQYNIYKHFMYKECAMLVAVRGRTLCLGIRLWLEWCIRVCCRYRLALPVSVQRVSLAVVWRIENRHGFTEWLRNKTHSEITEEPYYLVLPSYMLYVLTCILVRCLQEGPSNPCRLRIFYMKRTYIQKKHL
jgi:hypothetical protein